MKITFTDNIQDVSANQWDTLVGNSNPFIKHSFLLALEHNQCLHPWGWTPQHCLIFDNDELIGACPAYLKENSYGEFVFDWAWADAFHRNGLNYYPKLVTAIPFTPAQGPRLLVKLNHRRYAANEIKMALIRALLAYAEEHQLSSAHFLFCEEDDMNCLQSQDLLPRFDYQFHWQNRNYQHFDDFLNQLTSKRRKNIRRERRKVSDSHIQIETINGNALTDLQWQKLMYYYQSTFLRKSGTATLTEGFFRSVATDLRAIIAYHNKQIVAGAICFEGADTLYGRHWGCEDDYDSLHFEVCYYTGIEYCISHRINSFEPGAQGEHKIWRGFLPVKTRSAHWITHPQFKAAIADFLARESTAMNEHGALLLESSPFKKN